jgi:hypothetical protein
MPGTAQPPRDIAAHPAKPYDSQLHRQTSFSAELYLVESFVACRLIVKNTYETRHREISSAAAPLKRISFMGACNPAGTSHSFDAAFSFQRIKPQGSGSFGFLGL